MPLILGLVLLLTALGIEGYRGPVVDDCEELYAAAQEISLTSGADEQSLQEALSVLRETRACYGNASSTRVHWLLLREISLLYQLGHPREALTASDTLLARLQSQPDSTTTSRAYQWRGYVHYFRGDLTQSVSNYASSLAYATDETPVRTARLYRDIAVVYQRMRDFGAAARYVDRGLSLVESGGRSTDEVRGAYATLLGQKADLFLSDFITANPPHAERIDIAAEYARESVDIWRDLGDAHELGNALIILADALSILGHHDESIAQVQEAVQIFEETGSLSRQTAASWKHGLALLRAGLYQEAENKLRDALALARESGHLDFQRHILTNLGELHAYRRDFERAEHYKALAVAVTEAYRAPLRGTEWSPVAFRGWQKPYRGRVRSLVAQERYEDAFMALEQMRARHLEDLRQQNRIVTYLPDADRAVFDSLTTVLIDLRTALAADTTSTTVAERLRLEESRLQAQRRSLLDMAAEQPALDLATLQDALAERGKVLLSYFIDAEHEFLDVDKASYVFVITEDTLVAEPLNLGVNGLQEMLGSVSPVLDLEDRHHHGVNEQQFALDALHALYQELVTPVEDYLPDGAPLAIVPDGALYGFPFGMLVAESVPRFRYRDAPFLLRRHPVSVQLAARAVQQAPESRGSDELDVLAVGQSMYQGWTPAAVSGVIASDSLIDLPSVPDEVSGIGRLFRHSRVLLDRDATKANLQHHAAQARVVHIASHTAFSSLSPLYNALLLGGEASERDEGVVFLHEVQHWEVGADLVVLSGCDTGRGVLMGGDGMASLQNAFHSLGVPSSVATLWLVDDRAMAGLMQRFYRQLRTGAHKDEALQRAQLEFLDRAEGPRASPFFWAAPVLYGAPDPIDLAPRPFYRAPWFPYVAALALVVGIVLVFWRRRSRGCFT